MQWATTFYANHSLDGPMDASWLENAKCYFFEIPPKNSSLFLLYFERSETWNVFEEYIFNLSIFI